MSESHDRSVLAYAAADARPARDRLRGVGVASTVVACVGLVVGVAITRVVLAE